MKSLIKSLSSKLSKVYFWSLYLFPTALFFSYYPIISLGATETMNFELSITLLYLVWFDLISAMLIAKNRLFRRFFTQKKWLFLIFPLWASLSIFWSENPLRAILTAGILWLLYWAIFAIIIIHQNLQLPQNHLKNLQKSILIPAIIVSLWCWLQCFLDLAGFSSDTTLLCLGCVSESFGFPHPNGFAIEPQFMGNLLLAPILLSLYLWLKNPKSLKLLFLSFFLSATLFLIFSRGAIYSLAVALIFLIVALIVKQKSWRPLLIVPLVVFSLLFTLNIQGLMSEFSKTNDTYLSGISKVIDQLSLGIFHLTTESKSESDSELGSGTESQAESSLVTQSTSSLDSTDLDTSQSENPSEISSVHSGYVAESTNIRLNLTSVALTLWSSSPKNIIFGVGLGSAGISLYSAGLISNSKEIVQNEYASLLLETGILGFGLFLLTISLLCRRIFKLENHLLIFSILLAYAISLFFFAGLPNALHIYLFPPILCYNKKIK